MKRVKDPPHKLRGVFWNNVGKIFHRNPDHDFGSGIRQRIFVGEQGYSKGLSDHVDYVCLINKDADQILR